ncbi:uncharacterized protein [Mytilus edulis]|uniref:uncharacterized protein n=1 Tax=Mytilus edulis TaxID=6550 RepID=UPI0039EE6438
MLPMKNKMESSKSDGLKIPKDNSSAFYLYDKKRDSGYLTNSPATPATPNNNLQFDFDEDNIDSAENLSHSAKFNKFEDSGELSDDCFYDAEEMSENTDKEVECAMSLENIRSVPIPILVRPSAPAPQPFDNHDVHGNLECISETLHFTAYSFNRGSPLRSSSHHYKRRHFRPIGQRTISTQTPHQNSQILQQAVNTLSDRFHPYDAPLGRGTVHNRLRHNSDDYVPHEPLPDLVPMARGRDRSISLPDVPALREAQETEVGKELRRISDEFHFSYHTPRQARIMIRPHPGSFPGTWRFGGFWDSLRQLFTPSPTNPSEN